MRFLALSRQSFRYVFVASLFAAIAGIAAACSDGGSSSSGGGGACAPDIASIQKTVFAASCAQQGCHLAMEPAAFLDLTSASVEGKLVGAPSATCTDRVLVVPGHPEQSFLFEKISAAMPSCGTHMPPAGGLSADAQSCIEQWIASLPPNDSDGGTDAPSCETCGGASCVDTQTNPANCGACGSACPPGATCAGGQCACSGALTACGDACVDTAVDAANCGKCGNVCPQGSVCANGQCACPGGLEACGSACVDTSSDAMNCGTCGNACGAGKVCNMGVCAVNCGSLTKCGSSCVDTTTSVLNCGVCGNVCPTGASCAAGMCSCPAGTSVCNSTCINTTTDPANCGGCGTVCPAGTTCLDGSCACPGGGTACGGSCVDTQSDLNNCGTCGNACAAGQTCAAGQCTCGSSSVSFAADVQPIFTASCASAGCHKGIASQEGLDLSAGKAYAGLVNVNAGQCNDGRKRVLPGDPAKSYLIDKMMGVDLCFGTTMPKNGSLPNAQLTTVANWICAGAPNN